MSCCASWLRPQFRTIVNEKEAVKWICKLIKHYKTTEEFLLFVNNYILGNYNFLKIKKEVVVSNKLGIHARPAAMFVKIANKFSCDVYVEKDDERVNGKSIMGLMMLAAGPGSRLMIYAEGEDAARVVVELEALLKRKFDED